VANSTLKTGTCEQKTASTAFYKITVTGDRASPGTATSQPTLLGALSLAQNLTRSTTGATVEILLDPSRKHAVLHQDHVVHQPDKSSYPQYTLKLSG
jgi:hypothetical protein